MKIKTRLQTVVETPEFIKRAQSCMSDESKQEFISYIAKNPTSGDVMAGTGGVRKVRWGSVQGKGKSGGSRVIYYYHNKDIPIFLFTAYGKSDKANLTKAERNELKDVVALLVEAYGG